MLFAKIIISIIAAIMWTLGAHLAAECTSHRRISRFIFALPVLPLFFEDLNYRATPARYVLMGICYGLSISCIIILITVL
jgi:hypothetical protein